MKHTIRGMVLGPDGDPVPGAEVLWVGYHKPKVTPSVMPKDDEDRRSQRPVILARSLSESNGRFGLFSRVVRGVLSRSGSLTAAVCPIHGLTLASFAVDVGLNLTNC